MTIHAQRGSIPSVWQDDGYGTLRRITFSALIARVQSGWGEL